MHRTLVLPLLAFPSACLPSLSDPKDSASEVDSQPLVSIVAPGEELSYWADVPAPFAVEATDPGGDLAQVRLEYQGTPEGGVLGTAGIGGETAQADWIASLPAHATGLSATVTDQGGREATATMPVQLLPCGQLSPALRWPFEDDTGSTVLDTSGHANGLGHITLAHADGLFLQALDLTAGDNFVTVKVPEPEEEATVLTLVVYTRFGGEGLEAPEEEQPIVSLEGPSGRLAVQVWTDSVGASLGDVVESRQRTGTQAVLHDGAWHQVAITLDSEGQVRVWVDGASAYYTDLVGSPAWSGSTLYLGAEGNQDMAHGLFDDLTLLYQDVQSDTLDQARMAANGYCLR